MVWEMPKSSAAEIVFAGLGAAVAPPSDMPNSAAPSASATGDAAISTAISPAITRHQNHGAIGKSAWAACAPANVRTAVHPTS